MYLLLTVSIVLKSMAKGVNRRPSRRARSVQEARREIHCGMMGMTRPTLTLIGVSWSWYLNPLTTNQPPQMLESLSTGGMDYRHTVYDYRAVNWPQTNFCNLRDSNAEKKTCYTGHNGKRLAAEKHSKTYSGKMEKKVSVLSLSAAQWP